MTLRLRELTDDERVEVQRITRSHTLGAAFVRRAQIVVHAMSGLKAEEIAAGWICAATRFAPGSTASTHAVWTGWKRTCAPDDPRPIRPSSVAPSSPRP